MPSEAFQTAFAETGRLIRQCVAGAYADGADGDGFRPYLPLTQRHHFNLLHRPAQKTLADGSEFQRNIADVKTVVGIVVVGIEQSFLSKDACGFFGSRNRGIDQRDIARLPAD